MPAEKKVEPETVADDTVLLRSESRNFTFNERNTVYFVTSAVYLPLLITRIASLTLSLECPDFCG